MVRHNTTVKHRGILTMTRFEKHMMMMISEYSWLIDKMGYRNSPEIEQYGLVQDYIRWMDSD